MPCSVKNKERPEASHKGPCGHLEDRSLLWKGTEASQNGGVTPSNVNAEKMMD